MIQQETQKQLLGEIETEIVGMNYQSAKLNSGGAIDLEREPTNGHDPCAIRIENGLCEPVGYLPRELAAWLAPLVDQDKIHIDGFVPNGPSDAYEQTSSCRLTLSVYLCEQGRPLLDKSDPCDAREALHQTVLQAYENAQSYRDPNLVLGLASGLRPLQQQELLPETRLLMALLPGMAREVQAAHGIWTTVRFRELLGGLAIGKPIHRQSLTFFPLLWSETREPTYTLLSTAIETGQAKVEEVSESGSVPNLAINNQSQRPVLITEGEILIGAKQNRVINVTVLVAAGVKFLVPVSCVEQGRWQYGSRQFESKFFAPPSLRNKKLKAVQKNRSENGHAASDQGEVWDEVRACLSSVEAHSKTVSLTDGFVSMEEELQANRAGISLPDDAAGVLVGRAGKIIGLDLFDSATTFKVLWQRLSDAYSLDALRNSAASKRTSRKQAQRFLENLGNAARPRMPALAMGDELEIASDGFVGSALIYDGGLCHLAAFSD